MINNQEVVINVRHRALKKGAIISVVKNGLGSKFKNKQVSEDSLLKLICKNKKCTLSEKIKNNYNFFKKIIINK